jgi:hypothetical protein
MKSVHPIHPSSPCPTFSLNELKLDLRTFDRDLRMLRPSHSNVNRNKKIKRICNIDCPQIFDATNRPRRGGRSSPFELIFLAAAI